MPAEIQPLLPMEQTVKWGEVKTATIAYSEALGFFRLEKQGLVRFICVTSKHDLGTYECVFMERIPGP